MNKFTRCPNCGNRMNKTSGHEKQLHSHRTGTREFQPICLTCVRNWQADPLAHLKPNLQVRKATHR